MAATEPLGAGLSLRDIPALRAFSGPSAPSTIALAQSWNPGDGPGLFDLDEADAQTADDGGVIIVDRTGRRWKRRISQTLDVRWWGARDDGMATPATTLAFRAAIAFAKRSNGRYGRISLGAGHFKLWPQAPGEDVLAIDFGGVSFGGAGVTTCILDCYARGGLDPNTHWDVIGGHAWRGALFSIKGGKSDAERLSGFAISGMTCRGNATRTGNNKSPADAKTGDGWDISHKCVFVQPDRFTSDISIEDVDLTGWRGEIIYAGGMHNQSITVARASLHETNGSALSVTCGFKASDLKIWNAYNGIENYPGPNLQQVTRIQIDGCLANGMAWGGAMPPLDNCVGVVVDDVTISNCAQSGLLFTREISHLQMSNVKITDCATAVRFEPQARAVIHDLTLSNIQVFADKQTINTVIGLFIADDATIRNVQVSNLTATITPQGRSLGRTINRSIVFYGPIGETVRIDDCAIQSKTAPAAIGETNGAPQITRLNWTKVS